MLVIVYLERYNMKKRFILINLFLFSIFPILLNSCSSIDYQKDDLEKGGKVEIQTIGEGTVEIVDENDLNNVSLNKTLVIKTYPATNYKTLSIFVNELDLTNDPNFIIGDSNDVVHIVVTFTKINNGTTSEDRYGVIKLGNVNNGTISFKDNHYNNESVLLGTKIQIVATPNEGYKLNSLSVNNESILSTLEFIVEKEITYIIDADFIYINAKNDYSYLYDNKIKPTRGNQSISYDEYYESARGLKGLELKNELHNIIKKGSKSFSYKSLNSILPKTDVDPYDSSNFILTYEGSYNKSESFNKEHTWAKSHGGFGTSQPTGSDIHNLRPSNSTLNSTRGNLDFGTVLNHSNSTDCGYKYNWSRETMKGNYIGSGKSVNSTVFEPKDEFKGDVARMIFYMATRYDSDDSYDLEVSGAIDTQLYYDYSSGAKGLHGVFKDLYEWATSGIDPVSDFEVNRNNIIDEDYQHNRNPFIDHPEFIIMIYDKNYSGPGALNE